MKYKRIKPTLILAIVLSSVCAVHQAQAGPYSSYLQLTRVDAFNNATHLFAQTVPQVTEGPMDFEVALSGANIQIRIGQTTVVTVNDPNPITQGGIALGAIWESKALFDDVSVRKPGIPEPLFEDNFNSGSMSPDWITVNPSQGVEGGWLWSQDLIPAAPRNSILRTHSDESDWTDYTLNVKVDPVHDGDWENALIFFRARDFRPYGDNQMWTGYCLYVFGPNHGNVPEPSACLLLSLGGLAVLYRRRR